MSGMDTKQKRGPKDKHRNNEKRKEKSRDAARCRRSKETEIFADLAAAIPVSQDQLSQLDKASIMRLAISYLRVRDMINLIPALPPCVEDNQTDESSFMKSLEGFLLVLSNDGDIVYLSENVSDYLGIGQIDLMGQNIYDYSHPCDHDEIRELLSDKAKDDGNDSQKSFFIRLKCTLTSKGRSVNLKSATYKVLHLKGHILRPEPNRTEDDAKFKNCFAAIANPIPHPSNIEAPLPRQTFVTKHSLDMKFIHADDEIMRNVLGYHEEELLGKSVYEYHHAMDSDSIISAYKCLFSKGQCETSNYRFLAKNGGYVWVMTQATLIYDKMGKPQSVVCVNYVISGVECENEVYSAGQLSCVTEREEEEDYLSTKIEDSEVVLLEEVPLEFDEKDHELFVYEEGLGPKRNTEKILTQRTEEMSRGFLAFTEDSGLTMLKEEPDDLTHLAPVASDVCVPLEDHPFLAEVFDDLLLKDNFNPLMMDEPLDPFISYRDTYDMSPELLSPTLSKNYDSSLPSLNSPSNSLGEDDHISTFVSYPGEEDRMDSSVRPGSPYIPMSMDDLPLLLSSSNDLMWSNSSSPVPPSPTRAVNDSSSLAQLLSTTVKTTTKSNATELGQSLRTETTTSHANKRPNSSSSILSNKRMKTEQSKEKVSSELLQQLMSNNTANSRGRPKKSSWLLDSHKATCVSQPSDSVLMNLLDSSTKRRLILPQTTGSNLHRYLLRVNSKSLLVPETEHQPITSLLTLTDRDYEVNAPVNSGLLQGEDLIKALEICDTI